MKNKKIAFTKMKSIFGEYPLAYIKWWERILLPFIKSNYSYDNDSEYLCKITYKIMFGKNYIVKSDTIKINKEEKKLCLQNK